MSQPAPTLSVNLEPNPSPALEPLLPASPDLASPEPASSAPARAGRSFVGHAKLVGALTLVSRLAGLAREIVATRYMGDGLVASAFTFAFSVPNLFRKLFG